MAFHKGSPHSYSLQEAASLSLEPAHPRPATFTTSVKYMPRQQEVFPSGYQPPGSKINSQYSHHSREITIAVNTSLTNYGEFPVSTRCPNCKETIVTAITYRTGSFTWILAGSLVLFGCCLLPFCIHSCKDVIHLCPRCEHILGVYKRTFKS